MAARGGSSRQSAVKAKVVLLGEGAVGKTSIVLRYFENKFNDKHEQTLQVGLECKIAIMMLCGACLCQISRVLHALVLNSNNLLPLKLLIWH